MKMTNMTGLSLPLAVWLASDDYDFNPQGKSISATALLKPPRQILLRERITPEESTPPDVIDRIPSRMGHAIHDSIEKAWTHNYAQAMKLLGYPDKLIQKVRINPDPKELTEDIIPVYLEVRGSRSIMGYRISGKFDQAIDGELNDTKSTSVYSVMKNDKSRDYILQGSLYRWIHQDIITSDYIQINYVFTDWQRAMARANPDYPQTKAMSKSYPLMSIQETENWIKAKIRQLENAADLPEQELPRCTDAELWRSDPVWKYYSNPAKTDGRATKNFPDQASANAFLREKGKGVVIEVPGQVKACSYCPVFNICSQKDEYEHG